MKKRIYNKILHEFEDSITDSVRIYLSRPQGSDFQEISLDIIKINVFMLLSFQMDKGIIKIGKENRVKEILLKEINHETNKLLSFAGQIVWIFKKKNIDTQINQKITITFDLANINKKRIPYKIDFKE